MTALDPLDRPVAISVDLTETGLSMGAKSRFVTAVDRLSGNLVDLFNLPLERLLVLSRAKTEGSRQIIEATATYGVNQIAQNGELAERAFKIHYNKIIEAQTNKDAVVQFAKDDLHNLDRDCNSEAAENVPLSIEFLNRFEHYAEEASTEELRERWGKILASEIRTPGKFSRKILRAVDELDRETAEIFKELCKFKAGDCILKSIMPELSYENQKRLVEAELIFDFNMVDNTVRFSSDLNLSNGTVLIHFNLGDFGIAFDKDTDFSKISVNNKIMEIGSNNKPSIPIVLLTQVGEALGTVINNTSKDAVIQLKSKYKELMPDAEVYIFENKKDGKAYFYN